MARSYLPWQLTVGLSVGEMVGIALAVASIVLLVRFA
jgi:hypothetical protein